MAARRALLPARRRTAVRITLVTHAASVSLSGRPLARSAHFAAGCRAGRIAGSSGLPDRPF